MIPGRRRSARRRRTRDEPRWGGPIIDLRFAAARRSVDRRRQPRRLPQGASLSGDPRPDRVVLWTRIEPSAAGRGDNDDIELILTVTKDEALKEIVASREGHGEGRGRSHGPRSSPPALSPVVYFYRFEF